MRVPARMPSSVRTGSHYGESPQEPGPRRTLHRRVPSDIEKYATLSFATTSARPKPTTIQSTVPFFTFTFDVLSASGCRNSCYCPTPVAHHRIADADGTADRVGSRGTPLRTFPGSMILSPAMSIPPTRAWPTTEGPERTSLVVEFRLTKAVMASHSRGIDSSTRPSPPAHRTPPGFPRASC